MSIRNIALALIGLICGGLLAFIAVGGAHAPEPSQQAKNSGRATVGGPFTLTDQTGRRVTEKDFQGKHMLVFFGFTNCPDICPSGLQVMTAALDKLGPKADTVTPVFITLDSARDTPEKLALYLQSFHPRLVGLTGTEAEIAAVVKSYRVYSQKVIDEKTPANYSFDHAALFYLMDKDGTFKAPVPHTTDVDEFARTLAASLS